MERNEINNSRMKININNIIIDILLQNKLVDDIVNTQIQYGYLFVKEDGVPEGLIKATNKDKAFYFAVQKGSLMLIDIDEQQYRQTIDFMRENHVCLKDETEGENEKEKNRRLKNNEYLMQNGISISKNLRCDTSNVQLKELDEVCRRAIACILSVQIACEVNTGHYEEARDLFLPLFDKFGVKEVLNEKEKRIIDGSYTQQDAIDMDWAYEAYWALCWCLSLIDDIKDGGVLCDCEKAFFLVYNSPSYDAFKSACNLRNVDEILDMRDLYYRYHWAIVEKRSNPNALTGNLDRSNVIERRRALEWIVSDLDDWYDVELIA